MLGFRLRTFAGQGPDRVGRGARRPAAYLRDVQQAHGFRGFQRAEHLRRRRRRDVHRRASGGPGSGFALDWPFRLRHRRPRRVNLDRSPRQPQGSRVLPGRCRRPRRETDAPGPVHGRTGHFRLHAEGGAGQRQSPPGEGSAQPGRRRLVRLPSGKPLHASSTCERSCKSPPKSSSMRSRTAETPSPPAFRSRCSGRRRRGGSVRAAD